MGKVGESGPGITTSFKLKDMTEFRSPFVFAPAL